MRIALSGAQSVGKTTLLEKIVESEILKGFHVCKEIVRTLQKQGFTINKDADHASQCLILQQHYKNTLQFQNLLTDRSALDAFVYATWGYLNNRFTYKEHSEHERIFQATIKSYDINFYMPPQFPIVGDGVRDEDETYRAEIHKLFQTMIIKYEIPCVYLSGSVQERFDAFSHVLIENK